MSAPKDTRAAGLLAAAQFARRMLGEVAKGQKPADLQQVSDRAYMLACGDVARWCEAQARAAGKGMR